MPTLAHRRTPASPPLKRGPADRDTAGVGNAAEGQSMSGAAVGPFDTPFLNAALTECFGTSLRSLSARRDPASTAAVDARATTQGRDMVFGADVSESLGDLDGIETIAHETAHALAGGGSGATALDTANDPGETQADSAGAAFRAWAQGGFEGGAPSLRPASLGRATLHRDARTGGQVTGSPALRNGDVGWQVRALQSALNAHGAGLAVDGAFGPRTYRAVVAFQQRNGLAADGVVGPLTAAALNRGQAAPVPQGGGENPVVAPTPGAPAVTGTPMMSFGSRGALVSALQRLLKAKGGNVTLDGVFGAQTHAAVRAFQATNGLEVDGVVGPGTARALNDPASKVIAARPPRGQGPGGSGQNGAFGGTRDAVIAAAQSHLGAPYYWGADGPSMFDCSGLVLYVLRQDTGLVSWGDDTAQGLRNRLPRTNNPQKGDLVFYASGGRVQHVEMVMGEGSREIGSSGGGSNTYGDNPRAKVQYGDMNDDSRSRSYGSIEQLIAQKAGRT